MTTPAAPEYATPEPILTSDGAEMKPLLYIQQRRALYKVSTVYRSFITAVVCFDHNGKTLGRTTVRRLTAEQAGHWVVASNRIIQRYHDYLDKR